MLQSAIRDKKFSTLTSGRHFGDEGMEETGIIPDTVRHPLPYPSYPSSNQAKSAIYRLYARAAPTLTGHHRPQIVMGEIAMAKL